MATPGDNQRDPDIDDFQPAKKRPKKAVLPAERFKAPTSDEDMTRICKGFVPHNMLVCRVES